MTGVFWILAGVMASLVALILLLPLFRRATLSAEESGGEDLRVYRDQLSELDKDLEQGRLSENEGEAAKREIQRRLLAADRRHQHSSAPARVTRGRALAIALVLLIVPGVTLSLYLTLGMPGMPGMPLAERTAEIEEQKDMRQLVEQLRQKLEANPGDPQGWFLLGRSYMTMERFGEAAAAFTKAAELEKTSPELWSTVGEALTYADSGNVPPKGLDAFAKALALNPQEPRALFYLALSYYQEGDPHKALAAWADLARNSPASAPWRPSVLGQIERTASELGVNMASLDLGPAPEPAPGPLAGPMTGQAGSSQAEGRGPTAEDMAAAAQMSSEDQQAMINSMVDQLTERMEENPDDLDGWLRLIRAQLVLGREDAALASLKRAEPLIADLPEDSPRRRAVEEGLKKLAGQ
ncbi:c-type cytochrome biogenesis protein CcmI [Rhodovibrionaceae bacterium A322]